LKPTHEEFVRTHNFHFVHLKSYYETAGTKSKVLARHSGANLTTGIIVILAKPTNMRLEAPLIMNIHTVIFWVMHSSALQVGEEGGVTLSTHFPIPVRATASAGP
jgi:hypothetical protein